MRVVTLITLLALAFMTPACEDGPPWTDSGTPASDEGGPDFGPAAAYNRHFIFLGPGADLPTAAVFDFIALSDSLGVRRGARARMVDGTRWRRLMDVGWEMEPMRQPWRLVPHGPLKMVVGETGDLGTLVHRDSVTTRLEFGATLAEHSPDVGTQLVLRSARLAVEGESVPGVLLDAQLGRGVNPALVARDTAADAAADTTDTTDAADSAADSTAGSISATPIARSGAEALLLDNAGYYTVMTAASEGPLAWIHHAEQDHVRPGARLEPTAWSSDEETGAQVPTAWRIVSEDGALTGQLTAQSTDWIVLGEAGRLETLAYVLVAGWMEDRTVRRDVFGLVRHVQ